MQKKREKGQMAGRTGTSRVTSPAARWHPVKRLRQAARRATTGSTKAYMRRGCVASAWRLAVDGRTGTRGTARCAAGARSPRVL